MALIELIGNITYNCDKKMVLKALDTVNHEIMLKQLHHYGIPNSIMMKFYYCSKMAW